MEVRRRKWALPFSNHNTIILGWEQANHLEAALYSHHAKFPIVVATKYPKALWKLKDCLSHPFVVSLRVTGPRQRLDDTYACVGFENPELPPLSDPELFENVFLQGYSSGQPKFMRKYGDSLLRTLTYDVLAELLGSRNVTAITNAIPFAVSNAFYERLILHYDLGNLCAQHEKILTSHKSVTKKRGDVLESYIAAIEMDISRCGEGHREIRAWLFKVMALRLRTILPGHSHAFAKDENSMQRIWWEACNVQYSPDFAPDSTYSETPSFPTPVRTNPSAAEVQLHNFRRAVFEKMKEIYCQVSNTIMAPHGAGSKAFWAAMEHYLTSLYADIHHTERSIILVHYYRVRRVLSYPLTS